MSTKQLVVGIVAGLSLFTACTPAAQPAAPAATAPESPAASAPPSSAAAPGGIDIDAFMSTMVAAQKGVKTYTIDMSMKTEMAGKPAKIVMVGVVDQTDRSNITMSMDMDMAGMKVSMLKINGDMYLQLGATGKKWMKVPKDQMAQYEGTTDSADMTVGMEKARSAMKKIELVGDEAVDGTATRHYRITVDADGLSKITGSDAKIAGDTFDYDVWLDGANLLRKVAMDVKAKTQGEDLPMVVAATMGHYDEPVVIKAPGKDDIVEMGG
jgi:hypothetical protein